MRASLSVFSGVRWMGPGGSAGGGPGGGPLSWDRLSISLLDAISVSLRGLCLPLSIPDLPHWRSASRHINITPYLPPTARPEKNFKSDARYEPNHLHSISFINYFFNIIINKYKQ